MNWYYAIEGRSQGPVTENSLKRLAREGAISPDTLVWHQGLEEWEQLAKLKPDIAEQAGASVESRDSGGKRGRAPLPKQAGQKGGGVLKRILGWKRES